MHMYVCISLFSYSVVILDYFLYYKGLILNTNITNV